MGWESIDTTDLNHHIYNAVWAELNKIGVGHVVKANIGKSVVEYFRQEVIKWGGPDIQPEGK